MRLYLHIGWPKTGSSAIQSHLFSNQAWLRDRGVYVPRTGYSGGLGHAFLAGAAALPSAQNTNKSPASDPGLFGELAQELDTAANEGYRCALVSWEGLALLDKTSISAAHQSLQNHETVLLAYVRNQVELYESATLQELELLLNSSPDKFFTPGAVPELKLKNYEFFRKLSLWKSVFGDGLEVRTKLYKRALLKQGNVVVDFLDWIELEADDDFLLQDAGVNRSLDSNAAAMLLVARKAGLPHNGMIRLARALSQVGSTDGRAPGHFLCDTDRTDIMNYFSADNKRLFEQFPPENSTDATLYDDSGSSAREAKDSGSEKPSDPGPTETGFDYLKRVHAALASPEKQLWEGGVVTGRNLIRFTLDPGFGWRAARQDGAWSRGGRSGLAFRVPPVHPRKGPGSIRLLLSGEYAEGHSSTSVSIRNNVARIDLTRAVLTIAMDEQVLQDGVEILLEHDEPPTADESESDDQYPAYKLSIMSYDFMWE